ncbi:MAG: hypothetical protein GXP25_11365 [Planctomycetes bacterium]|nr:hypothetical protein [Planctomycetota bacterium]
MISCTEFIPFYSELFRFLEEKGGKKEVVRFWEALSDEFLGNLRKLAKEKGLAGCFEYWSHTLTEEAADFTMTLNEDEGWFRIDMHECPSMGMLLRLAHIEPYHAYCEHCMVLYPRVLEPLGFRCEAGMTDPEKPSCFIHITRDNPTQTKDVS